MKTNISVLSAILIFSFGSCGKHDAISDDATALAQLHCAYLKNLQEGDADTERLKDIQHNYTEYLGLKDSLSRKYNKEKDQLIFFKKYNQQVVEECGSQNN